MMARYTGSYLPLLLLLVSLAGCKVDSTNPISPPENAHPDPTIYGAWRYKANGELTYLHIGPEFSLAPSGAAGAPNRRTRLVLVDHKPNGLTDEAYVAFTSRVGKQRYLNVAQVEDGKTVGYILVQYVLADGNTLRFSTMNQDALKSAISSGRIQGTTRGEGLSSETAVTAESSEIEAFLAHDGGKLFTNWTAMKRVP